MNLEEIKARLTEAEPHLPDAPFTRLFTVTASSQDLHLCATDRLRRKCRRGRVWKSSMMLSTLQNAAYGFQPDRPRSRGGQDGIFRLDRRFRPPNKMMAKLFGGYLDKPGSGAEQVAAALGVPTAALEPVRLVSHHMRLLGVLARRGDAGDWLVLVDYDDTK